MSDSLSLPSASAEAWLADFRADSPQGRYERLLQALQHPTGLSTDDLAYAVASVSQMLSHHNLISAQKALAHEVATQTPAVHAQVAGIFTLLELQEALADRQPERFAALFQFWLKAEPLPPLALILKSLAYAGYAQAAGDYATTIASTLTRKQLEADDELGFALEQHRIHQIFETLLHSLEEGLDPDWEGFAQGLRQLGVRTKQEQAFFRDQLESSDKAQLSRLRNALQEGDPELALFHCRQLFGRWMYRRHRLDLFSSGDMVQQAFELWFQQAPEALPALEKLVRISPEQIRARYEMLEYEPDWDLLESLVLLWGLPHVYEWLEEIGLCNAHQREQVLASVLALRGELMARRENALWNFSFVHHWPRPQHVSAADFEAEAQRFCQTREQSTPLSTQPEDSLFFDEPTVEIPDELLDSVSTILAERGVEALDELIHELEHQLGPEAVDALLSGLQERGLLELETE
jgi:hypothetical protein